MRRGAAEATRGRYAPLGVPTIVVAGGEYLSQGRDQPGQSLETQIWRPAAGQDVSRRAHPEPANSPLRISIRHKIELGLTLLKLNLGLSSTTAVFVVTGTLLFSGRTVTAEVSLEQMMRNCLLLEKYFEWSQRERRHYHLS
jgi:hypothetical protein